MSIIQISGLTKTFGGFTAVDNLHLQIEAGEMFGFLGPNGAGKTTTLRMLLGTLPATHGEVRLFGALVGKDSLSVRRKLGVVMESQNFYDEMSAWEYLMFFGRLYEVEDAEQQARRLLERLNLWRFRDVLVSGFSTGMQRKLALARALMHRPEVLILDEPVSGLDPFGIVQIREILNEEHAAGRTILISSHILSEVERTASRVGILAGGKLVFEGSMDCIRRSAGVQQQVEIQLAAAPPDLAASIRALPFVQEVKVVNERYLVTMDEGREVNTKLGLALFQMGAAVQEMKVKETSLEDAFITLTESYVQNLTASVRPSGQSEEAQ